MLSPARKVIITHKKDPYLPREIPLSSAGKILMTRGKFCYHPQVIAMPASSVLTLNIMGSEAIPFPVVVQANT